MPNDAVIPIDSGTVEKPLRLRRRRDGSLALTGVGGSPNDATFPEVFTFGTEWLFENSANARMEGDQIVLELANGKARYDIAERANNSYKCVLVDSEFFEAAPVDETIAAERATSIRADQIKELARTANVDEDTAERILIAQGAISAVSAASSSQPALPSPDSED